MDLRATKLYWVLVTQETLIHFILSSWDLLTEKIFICLAKLIPVHMHFPVESETL